MNLLAAILGFIKTLLGLGNKVADAIHDAKLKQDGANAAIVQANEVENDRISEAADAGRVARAGADAVLAAPVELDPDNERANPSPGLLATNYRAAGKVSGKESTKRDGRAGQPPRHGQNSDTDKAPQRKRPSTKRGS